MRKNGFFRLGVHTNAFAIASDSVVLSSFLIIITSVTIPVSLCLLVPGEGEGVVLPATSLY